MLPTSHAPNKRATPLKEGWKHHLSAEFDQSYMSALKGFLLDEKKKRKHILPPGGEIFNCFNYTPFSKVKVVILGQDPYHGIGQAHGLSFSVLDHVAKPPSLVNIFKEIKDDLNIPIAESGNLTPWARQGVLLLNSVLTVEKKQAASHRNKGWEQFTDKVIDVLNHHKSNLVFMLWGNYAQEKGHRIDPKKHLILKSTHPSPFSYHRGFKGCRHFSKANAYLSQHHLDPINWKLEASCLTQNN